MAGGEVDVDAEAISFVGQRALALVLESFDTPLVFPPSVVPFCCPLALG
jgi:hypothetical protein